MAKFSERLNEMMQKRGIKAADLARITKIQESAISTYRSGMYEAKQKRVDTLARALNVSPSYLMGYTDVCLPYALADVASEPTRYAPLLGIVQAGYPIYAEENIEMYKPIPYQDTYQYIWLKVHGDSMDAAGLADGDNILVRVQPEVEDNQIAVVCVDGDLATVKRFHQMDNIVILSPQSTNPTHKPQYYDIKNVSIDIVGLVTTIEKEAK